MPRAWWSEFAKSLTRKATDSGVSSATGRIAIEAKRAQVIMASAQGFTPPKIAVIALMSEDYVRQLIHAFNLHGFSTPQTPPGPGTEGEVHRGPPRGAGGRWRRAVRRTWGLPYAERQPLASSREEAVQAGCWWSGSSGGVAPGHPSRVGGEPPETCERGRRAPTRNER